MVGIQKAVTQRSQCVCVCHLDHSVLPLKNIFCFVELYKTVLTKPVWYKHVILQIRVVRYKHHITITLSNITAIHILITLIITFS